MTVDKNAKRAARELAELEQISYTAARRRLTTQPEQVTTPVHRITVAAPCPVGCDGTSHSEFACRRWTAADAKDVASWQVREAAGLPTGRAWSVERRCNRSASAMTDHRWALALIYAMLTDQHPELRPDDAALRAAVEADDLAAVDALMDPLDRAVRRLVTEDPEQWWNVAKPRLDAYVEAVETDDRWPQTWVEAEYANRLAQLTARWQRAWTEYRNWNGYPDQDGVPWYSLRGEMDSFLTSRAGGHAPGTRVRLANGRLAVVWAPVWTETGAPTAYRVRLLKPAPPGSMLDLVIDTFSDETHPAADCLA
ncbi:hypothetical protein KCMC57_65070 (plasmid) [Kitasatospora sp. CMC57]|uniref:Uncharacterized protein n=1 Tax=Kitasatospora sp. CMC57 TaxID=3231513 RepID=A0AB33K9I4_9ACTN